MPSDKNFIDIHQEYESFATEMCYRSVSLRTFKSYVNNVKTLQTKYQRVGILERGQGTFTTRVQQTCTTSQGTKRLLQNTCED